MATEIPKHKIFMQGHMIATNTRKNQTYTSIYTSFQALTQKLYQGQAKVKII